MKQGWELKTLGDVCSVQRGLTYSGKDTVDYSSTVVLRATNIDLDSSSLVFDELKYLRDDFEIKEKYELKKGSLLICFSSGSKSHLGKVALVDKHYKYAFGGFIGQITPSNNIDPKYLFYSLISEDYKSYIAQLTDGVNINNLKIKDLQGFQIPVPPLEEQKQIVAKLDQCFEAIDKAKANATKNLENAKELFQSKLNEIFSQKGEGWVEKKLGDVCKYDKNKNQSNNLPYIGLEHIESNSGRFIGSLDSHQVKSSTFHFDSRHVLYGRLRPYLNKVLIPNFEGHCSTEIFPILVGNEIIREYLFYWLISDQTVKKIDATWTGARMPRANMNEVINFILPIPQVEEQKQIVKLLGNLREQTQSLESKYQQELNSLEELKKSILQKAFEGEL
jgi:type I restriction enzyme S subunit